MAETARVERARANPNGFQGRARHQSAGVSKRGRWATRTPAGVTLYVASNDATRPAGHLPTCGEGGVEPPRLALARFERGAVTTSAGSSRWSGWPDSNRRPPRPERGALTKLRYNPVGMAGVEPAASEPQLGALPLRHIPVPTRGVEPRSQVS